MIAAWAVKNWRLVLGAVVMLAVLAILGFAIWKVYTWREDALRLPIVQQELAQTRADLLEQQRLAAVANEASNGYQQELQALRARRVPARVVRLCSAADQGLPVSAGAGRPDGAAAGTGGSEAEARPGRDVGPELYAIADDCDAVAAQLRGLQAWVRGVAAP